MVYVYDDGSLFNRDLIDQGYARLYESEFSKRDQFSDVESDAQAADVGVWSFEEETPSTEPSENGLVVEEVHADADGNDHENENDEYIVFKNTNEDSIDISDWEVEDDADHVYTVPSGVTVDAGATITLYTGSGTDSETELYWGSDAAIWNNNGDTIYVRNASGDQVIEHEYP